MKKKVKIDILKLIKESPEERKTRVRESGTSYRTRIVDKSKTIYNRRKYKKIKFEDTE